MTTDSLPVSRAPAWVTFLTFVFGFAVMVLSANVNRLLGQTGIGVVVPYSLGSLAAMYIGFATVSMPWRALMASAIAYAVAALTVGQVYPYLTAGDPKITGGYIVGFVLATGLVALVWPVVRTRSFVTNIMLAFIVAVVASVLLYVPGLLWLNFIDPAHNWDATFAVGLTTFVKADLIKCGIVALAAATLYGVPKADSPQ